MTTQNASTELALSILHEIRSSEGLTLEECERLIREVVEPLENRERINGLRSRYVAVICNILSTLNRSAFALLDECTSELSNVNPHDCSCCNPEKDAADALIRKIKALKQKSKEVEVSKETEE